MTKAEKNMLKSCPVGVVMRSEAPLIEHLLTEREQPNYSVALDQSRTDRRWIPLSASALISLLALLDFFKFTK